ncbi:MAG: hypothetical protein HBSAPP03_02280 [Phycisphaerae bacterium]|nr:MAG: hypothetical protein HBSAPP03_02280 [Phycisphaerae bacterium]
MRTLADLAQQVLDAQDQVLFNEAVTSAGCGARRGAYILIWISCAESLKRRFNAVSARDGAAKRVAGEISKKEAAHSAIDMLVLEEARKYGLIDDPAHARLKHVYEMRCVYGHPYERQPSEEELAAAGVAVVDLVLSQPVLLRHGYLQEQVRLLSTDSAFLDDQEEAVSDYAKEVVTRTDPALVPWFLERLWAAGEAVAADKSQARFVRRIVWFSAAFLKSIGFDVKANDMRPPLSATPVVGSWSLSHPALFAALPPHAQDIVVGNLLERMKTAVAGARRLQELDSGGMLNDRQRERFRQALEGVKYANLAEAGIDLKYYVDRVIADLKSHNWYTQNPAIDALVSAGPEQVQALPEPLQQALGNNVLQCAEGSAASGGTFMSALADLKVQWPPRFVEGIVAECFVNDDNAIRFKCRVMGEALTALAGQATEARDEIISAVARRIAGGSPKSPHFFERTRGDAIAELDKVMKSKPGVLDGLRVIKNTIEAVIITEDAHV